MKPLELIETKEGLVALKQGNQVIVLESMFVLDWLSNQLAGLEDGAWSFDDQGRGPSL